MTTACIFALVLMIPQANAQCPAGTTNPLQAFAGTWTFESDGFNFPPTNFLASAGRITASIGADRAGNPLGVLTITQSSSIDGSTTRLETDAGRFAVFADCSGGTLTFNVSSFPVQFDFFFASPNSIVFVGTNNGHIISGTMTRVSADQVSPTCPANPLSTLFGTWAFEWDGFNFPPTMFLAAAGRFTASQGTDRAGNPIGLLSVTQSSSIDGSPTRLETDAGRFALNADCSGGTLTFNVSSRPVQFDFFFTNPNSIQLIATTGATIAEGSATRVP